MMTHQPHPLDIPDFLKATPENTAAARAAWKPQAQSRVKEKKHPFNLPKTIEPAGLELLRQMEATKKEKQAERFAALKALNEERKRNGVPTVRRLKPKANKIAFSTKRRRSETPKPVRTKAPKTDAPARYGVIVEGGVAFSFDARNSNDARLTFSAMRKRGEAKGLKVKSLRKIKPDDHGVGGGPVPHKGEA